MCHWYRIRRVVAQECFGLITVTLNFTVGRLRNGVWIFQKHLCTKPDECN